MRVTAFIRDYVKEEVEKKFRPAINAVMPEYDKLREELIKSCTQIAKKADEEARKLCREAGMLRIDDYPLITPNHTYRIGNGDVENERNKKVSELMAKRDQAVRDILLKLEIGEASKNDLKAAIDEVVVE